MDRVKIFSMYLPQYHETEENSRFWGKGFTDWVSVKNAVPLFDGHKQPERPLNDNYYDLSNVKNIEWQANLAKEYGIDAWGIYHYWFNSNQQALTKPSELLLNNKHIDMPFFFAWDNASWKRTWSKISGNDWAPLNDNKKNLKNEPEVLIEYKLGNIDDWKIHFDYLLPFFMDHRYVKHNGKPLFLIYRYESKINDMINYWNELAQNNGFDGMEIVLSYNPFHGIPKSINKFYYEPLYSGWGSYIDRFKRKILKNKEQVEVQKYDYEHIWKRIIRNAKKCNDSEVYYGGFVGYDDSPRRGKKGKVVIGSSPTLFGEYLGKLINICQEQNKPFIFLTAWNEWGEGAHLEPDSIQKYEYLKKVKEIKEKYI